MFRFLDLPIGAHGSLRVSLLNGMGKFVGNFGSEESAYHRSGAGLKHLIRTPVSSRDWCEPGISKCGLAAAIILDVSIWNSDDFHCLVAGAPGSNDFPSPPSIR